MSYSLRCNDLSFNLYGPGIITYSTILEKFFYFENHIRHTQAPCEENSGKNYC